MGNTIKLPRVIKHPSPVNIDRRIQMLQEGFAAGLPWLEVALGRAWKGYREDDASTKGGYSFPAVYSGKKEYFNALPNDTYKSYCFFAVRDKGGPATDVEKVDQDYHPGIWNEWRHRLDITFWFNCTKINPGIDYPITENLLADVKAVLRQFAFFTPVNVFYDPDTVFDNYSLDHIKEQQLSYPYGGFRIEGEIQFLEEDNNNTCGTY